MGSNEGRAWMSLHGVGHAELIVQFFGLKGGSKLTSYVTTRGVQKFPCMLQRGGFKTPPVSLYEGGS